MNLKNCSSIIFRPVRVMGFDAKIFDDGKKEKKTQQEKKKKKKRRLLLLH